MDRPQMILEKRNEAWKSGNLARVVRAFCFECMGGELGEVARCSAPECPLYPFRLRRSVSDGFNKTADKMGWDRPRAERAKGIVPKGFVDDVDDDDDEDNEGDDE